MGDSGINTSVIHDLRYDNRLAGIFMNSIPKTFENAALLESRLAAAWNCKFSGKTEKVTKTAHCLLKIMLT